MVKGLVELLGGTIGVKSAGLGRGAEFTLSLPLASPPGAAPSPEPKARAQHRRVLVIEDNEDVADTLADALECCGHEVQKAYDAQAGLQIARSFHPEVVICDIGLPIMDGYGLARAVRADEGLADVYLVALSGYAQPEDVRRSIEAGFNAHVAKPPSLDKLNRLLAAAESSRQS
jgi:two-component system CheB/CheR fusion protein